MLQVPLLSKEGSHPQQYFKANMEIRDTINNHDQQRTAEGQRDNLESNAPLFFGVVFFYSENKSKF